jgi:CysZ protein
MTLLLSGMILFWHDDILNLIWKMLEPVWILYAWKTFSWMVSIFLSTISMVISYIIAQLFFCVFIVDYMSKITELIILGKEIPSEQGSWVSIFIMIISLFTPFSPLIIFVSSLAAAVFRAWDNTDLVPSRRMIPLKERRGFFKKNIMFHMGFGILFLIPFLNILFLSFTPVGATLY